jgi:hypothetical protein
MIYSLLADCLVLVHFAFVAFVLVGGFLILWKPSLRWVHLPAVAWGVFIEFSGWICPLTPWEQALRLKAGQVGYTGGFVEHYLIPVLYPVGLTQEVQVVLGILVVAVNVAIYTFVGRRRSHGSLRS